MRIRSEHRGRQLPFERERRLVLRRLPAGAVLARAVLTLAPYSVDAGRRFLETIAFPDAVGDWGAGKTVSGTAVEVDLHVRRRLAAIAGSNLGGGKLLVDLGGGFLPVADDGGLGGGKPLPLTDAMDLPGLTVTGLRIAAANADVSSVRVASPPSNVTVAVEGGPVFFTHFGDLVTQRTTPDFSAVLGALLPELPVENGIVIVPFVVHSDTIARLDLTLELDVTVAVDAMPGGLPRVTAPYAYGGGPESTRPLNIDVPPGMVAVPGATTGRAQGAFDASRVAYGPVVVTASVPLPLTPQAPLAQPFVLTSSVVAGSVDLLLTAVTARGRLAVDVVADLDGKPGRSSVLSRPAELTLTRDQAGSAAWLNVALPEAVQLSPGVRRWLVLQAREGSAAWGTVPAQTPGPGLQRTTDGALSWRAIPGGDGAFRLRQTTAEFTMPLELRVGAGGSEVAVPLQRFAASGAVDFDLTFDGVGSAVNDAVAGARSTPPAAEHVANGDFADWYRVGTGLQGVSSEPADPGRTVFGPAVAFAPHGSVLYAGARGPGGAHLFALDVLCRRVVYEARIGPGRPRAIAVDPAGRRAVIATDIVDTDESTSSALVLVDLQDGRPVGVPVPAQEQLVALAASVDGVGVHLLGENDAEAVVRFVPWARLAEAAGGADLDWRSLPEDQQSDSPRALAAGADGRLYVLTAVTAAQSGTRVYVYPAPTARGTPVDVPAIADPRDLAVTPTADRVLVLGPANLAILRAPDLGAVGGVPLGADLDARCLAADPGGEVALVVGVAQAHAVDLRRRVVLPDDGIAVHPVDGAVAVIAPTGTHGAVAQSDPGGVALIQVGKAQPSDWEVTAGEVRPICLPGTGEVAALLGRPTLAKADPRPVKRRVPVPTAISQVGPAVGDTRYRFGFDGVALAEGAVGEVIWRAGDCAVGRADSFGVPTFDPERRKVLDRLPRVEQVLTSPPGAVQAEIRFATDDDLMLVDHVSLAASTELTGEVWQLQSPTATVTAGSDAVTIANGGAFDALAAQPVPLTAGQRVQLLVTARVTGDPAAVELAYLGEAGAPVGTPSRLPLDPLDFDERALVTEVPAGTVEGELRVVVPPGGSVELTAVSVTAGRAETVDLVFVSEAPGELSISGVSVQLDQGTPQPAPMPPAGLCPPTSGGGDDECYCVSCGRPQPVRRTAPAVTPAGRPARVSRCPVCHTDRVRVGGRPAVAVAEPVALPRFRATDRGAGGGPALVVRSRLDVALTEIAGISAKRAAGLQALGIPDVVALARADVATVATLPAVSEAFAGTLIVRAQDLVRTRGRLVVAGLEDDGT